MADYQNVARNMIYKEAVSQRFALGGLPDAKPAPRRKPSDVIGDPRGDIAGLRDAEVIVQAAVNSRPSDGLAEAAAAAKAQNKPVAAFVMARPEKPVGESYAVVSLSTLIWLLAEREAA